MTDSIHLLGISNAIVDILAHVDEEFLADIGVPRGSMTLIDEQRAREIYDRMGPATEMSGGSVANTVANFASLGGRAAYIGRVKADQLGEIFNHDMRALGVDIRLEPSAGGAPTARSHILITPDGQRTMQTYLGACTELAVADVTDRTVGTPRILLLEGYVWDIPEGPELIARAISLAKQGSTRIALSLSDSFCVDRHRQEFRDAVNESVDIVFADDDEIMALFGTERFEDVLDEVPRHDKLFVMTRSEKGSVIVEGERKIVQQALPVKKVIDTTGAGDAYTAGFLYGLTTNRPLAECAKLGTYCATSIIQKVGARIDRDAITAYDRAI
ncbi:MAG TPA: adenosine kinase [Woeseiaceae bacterium]|nr:adenosine kinase [Woeseiaceae bacterium]